MSLLTYAIEVWGRAHYSKYRLSQLAGSTLWLYQQLWLVPWGGQDEPNLSAVIGYTSGQDGAILPARDTGFVPQGKFIMFSVRLVP